MAFPTSAGSFLHFRNRRNGSGGKDAKNSTVKSLQSRQSVNTQDSSSLEYEGTKQARQTKKKEHKSSNRSTNIELVPEIGGKLLKLISSGILVFQPKIDGAIVSERRPEDLFAAAVDGRSKRNNSASGRKNVNEKDIIPACSMEFAISFHISCIPRKNRNISAQSYTEFKSLHTKLTKEFPLYEFPELPLLDTEIGRTRSNGKILSDSESVQAKCRQLHQYIEQISRMKHVGNSPTFIEFLIQNYLNEMEGAGKFTTTDMLGEGKTFIATETNPSSSKVSPEVNVDTSKYSAYDLSAKTTLNKDTVTAEQTLQVMKVLPPSMKSNSSTTSTKSPKNEANPHHFTTHTVGYPGLSLCCSMYSGASSPSRHPLLSQILGNTLESPKDAWSSREEERIDAVVQGNPSKSFPIEFPRYSTLQEISNEVSDFGSIFINFTEPISMELQIYHCTPFETNKLANNCGNHQTLTPSGSSSETRIKEEETAGLSCFTFNGQFTLDGHTVIITIHHLKQSSGNSPTGRVLISQMK